MTALNQAADGVRTRDLNLGRVALYQLSYRRRWSGGYRAVYPDVMRARMYWPIVVAAAALVGLLTYGVVSKGTDTTIDQALVDGKKSRRPRRTCRCWRAAAPPRWPTTAARSWS